jgi:hypothetical protein
MKKTTLLFFFIALTFKTLAQSDYSRGFKVGYKKGYCYNDFSCIDPIPPITPIPYIGESSDDYPAGYNRGFKMGLEDKQKDKKSSGTNTNNSNTPPPRARASTYVSPDYDFLLKAIELKRNQQAANQQMEREKAMALSMQVKDYYNSLTSFPSGIPSGWHNVMVSDNYETCGERKVYVENGVITQYFVGGRRRLIEYCNKIKNCKTLIKLSTEGSIPSALLDIYFLDFINNPLSNTTAAVEDGKVSFWTDLRNCESLDLYFNGSYVTSFNSYFKSGEPKCGQNGTISISVAPGTYSYKGIYHGTFITTTIEDDVTVYSGACTKELVTK